MISRGCKLSALIRTFFIAGLILVLPAGGAFANGAPKNTEPSLTAAKNECLEQTPRCPDTNHTHRRAGYPQHVAWWAAASDTGSYIGYSVGGGCVGRRNAPCPDEGTWGWDYSGWFFPRRVALRWSHGQRYQGGGGYYRTVPKPNLAGTSTP